MVRTLYGGSVCTRVFEVGARAGDLAPQAIETALFAQTKHLTNRCHSKHGIGVRPRKPPQRAHRRPESLVGILGELCNLVKEFGFGLSLRFDFTGGLSEGEGCLIFDYRVRSNGIYRLDRYRSDHQG